MAIAVKKIALEARDEGYFKNGELKGEKLSRSKIGQLSRCRKANVTLSRMLTGV